MYAPPGNLRHVWLSTGGNCLGGNTVKVQGILNGQKINLLVANGIGGLVDRPPNPRLMQATQTVLDYQRAFAQPMDPTQSKTVLGTTAFIILLWLAIPLLGRREQPILTAEKVSSFNPSLSLQITREFVTAYPRRVLGTIEARQSTGFLQQHFQQLGYQVTYSHFDAVLAGRRQVGRNVYAFRAGPSPGILVVMAHYDTARTTFQGAMDDGSGVGVLLELARVFAGLPARHGFLFVASDGEEWGMLGALDFAQNHPERNRIAAALSLDYVAAGDLSELTLDTVGQMGGYSPPWLRILCRAAAGMQQTAVSEAAGFREFIERSLLLSWTDQGPLLNAGIAAINLGSTSSARGREWEVYHSPEDTIGNLKLESIERYGTAAEQILRTLDRLPSMPHESMEGFRVHENIMLAPRIMVVFQHLAFLPFFLTLYFHLANHRQFISPGRIQRELSCFFGALLPCLAPYPLILLLNRLRRIPVYSAYPATPKDPVLEHPQPGALGAVLITFVLSAVGCFLLVRFLNRKLPRADFHVSKTVLLMILGAIAVCSLRYNPYWAVTFLVLPVWLWGLVGTGRGPGGRAANRMMVLAAGVLYYMISGAYASRLGLGWKLVWYEILALSTGMFHWQAFLLGSLAVATGVRFLAIQSMSRND